MDYEISPEPSEAERAAIVAALAEEGEQPAVPPWGEAGRLEWEPPAAPQP